MAALAVAAHGFAGGGVPGSAGLTLLVLAAAALGAIAAGLRGRLALPALMALGQPVCHLALSGLAPHRHGTAAMTLAPGAMASGPISLTCDGAMIAAHTVAAVACAFLILAVERLYTLISRAVRVALAPPRPPLIGRATARRPRSVTLPTFLLVLGHSGPRAPPVTA